VRKAIAILWPSFLCAGLGTIFLFALLDLGFFFLWGLGAGSSWLTSLLTYESR
jgi:hypothetical protein